jgi:hypothetical protein
MTPREFSVGTKGERHYFEYTDRDELEILNVRSFEEAQRFIDRWLLEETLALAMGMSLKNASVGLELGGAKGSVLLAYPVERGNRYYLKPIRREIISEDNAEIVAEISRAVGRIWAENNIVSWNTLMPFVVSDMNNGIIVICQTHYQNPIIYGQRMSVEGKRFWPGIEGVPISDSPHKQWLLDEGNRDRQFVLSD